MERVSAKYVKIDKFDLFCNHDKVDIINNLLSYVIGYEKDNNCYIGDFYLNIDSKYYSELSKIFYFPVKRRNLLNAFIYAGYSKDLEMVFKLNSFITFSEVSLDELGNLSNYVLEHGIDFNEYLDGQDKKLIFDENIFSFYKGYIYDEKNLLVNKKIKK